MDPQMASAVIGALIGGISGYLASVFQQRRADKRRRKALVSALLTETGRLSKHVSIMGEETVNKKSLFYPVLDNPCEYVPFLKPLTIDVVLGLSGLLSEYRLMLIKYESAPTEDLRVRCVAMAAVIYNLTAHCIYQLTENEGGSLPRYMAFNDRLDVMAVIGRTIASSGHG